VLAAADEVDDLDVVPFGDHRLRVRLALEHDEITLDRDPARVDVQPIEELADREGAGDLMCVAVQGYLQFPKPILAAFG